MDTIDKIFYDLHYELITEKQAKQRVLDLFAVSTRTFKVGDIETAAVNAYKGKDLNEQRENIDKILAFEKGAKWALNRLSNNGR
jgi:hypothetical protein